MLLAHTDAHCTHKHANTRTATPRYFPNGGWQGCHGGGECREMSTDEFVARIKGGGGGGDNKSGGQGSWWSSGGGQSGGQGGAQFGKK